MDFEQVAAATKPSTQRSSRRLFVLGFVGAALTGALGVSDAEARSHHKKKRKRRRKHKRKDKPPP